jgi:hypothetical protein
VPDLGAAFVRLDAIRRLVLLTLGGFRHLFPRFADDRDRLADLDLLTFVGEDLEQHAARVGLDLLRHLFGVELVQRLALLHLLALGLEPLDDDA